MARDARPRPVSAAGTPLRVVSLPPADGTGPASYVWLLERALEAHGVAVVPSGQARPRWIARRRGRLDVLHLHWLEYLVEVEGTGPVAYLRAMARAAVLLAAIATAHARGMAVVWTVHNLQPHEDLRPRLNRLVQRALLARVDRTIVHTRHAARRLHERHPSARSPAVVPHGNYTGHYPAEGPARERLRAEMGVPDGGVLYLAFGQIRVYKRIPLLLRAFRALPDEDARLVVVGRVVGAGLEEELRRLAAADPRVVLRLAFVDEDELAALHQAADAAVFAYADLFSSGALLLAISLGLPVVVPAATSAAELVEDDARVDYEPDGLTAALATMAERVGPEARAAALRSAARYDWSRVAELTTQVYAQALARRR